MNSSPEGRNSQDREKKKFILCHTAIQQKKKKEKKADIHVCITSILRTEISAS